MEKEQIIALAERFIKGIATDKEKALLHQWYDDWQDDEETVRVNDAPSEDAIREKILAHLQTSLHTTTAPAPVRSIKKILYRIAAACVLLLLIAGAGYFIYTKQAATPAVIVQKNGKPDIAPGGNKAILTLNDGSTIVLDSAANGSLTQQGNTDIVKTQDGHLEYNVDDGNNNTAVEILYNTISTPRGGQYQLTLPDGSKVWLNAASSLRYPTIFKGNERKVTLTGEAYFEVARTTLQGTNTHLPFTVETGDIDVKVLGTHFNINAYHDEADVKTTLLEGSVDVIAKQKQAQTVRLLPGQQSQWSNALGMMKLVKEADIEQAVAWKNGLFKFNSTDLAAIMRQVSRWYDVDIVYEGSVKEETFSGDIPRKEYASEVFKMLELTKTVAFSIENKIVTIKPYKK
ncbi:MAG: FecR family protein [Agriterribacter sp.]